VYGINSTLQLTGNTIVNNWALVHGGGIYLRYGGYSAIEKCLIAGNESENGGGVYMYNHSDAEFVNCTIADNTVSGWAGGIYTSTFSYPVVMNTIVFGNGAGTYPNLFSSGDDSFTVSFSDIEGGWLGEGNIDGSPLFADPLNGDYNLTWANYPAADSTKSPCIDAGNPQASYNDPDGTRNDMGAFYFDQSLPAITDLQIEISGNDAVLSWSPVTSALEYRIYSSPSPYFEPGGEPMMIINAPDTSAAISEVISEQNLFFKIICGN